MTRKLLVAAIIIALVAPACVSQAPRPIERKQLEVLQCSEKFHRDALARDSPVFRIDSARSIAVIEARRAGSLARLGHHHVVASHDIVGYVSSGEGRADVCVQLERLTVDEPVLRAEAAMASQPSADAIEGTRQNMLHKVLEVERYPFAFITVRAHPANRGEDALDVDLTLHGVTRTLPVVTQIEIAGDELTASGRFTLNQTDFGMTPFAILGGAIAVQDALDVRFQIRASRMLPSGSSVTDQ